MFGSRKLRGMCQQEKCLLTEWLFVYDSNENYFNNRQCDSSGKMPCLGISVISLMFVAAALLWLNFYKQLCVFWMTVQDFILTLIITWQKTWSFVVKFCGFCLSFSWFIGQWCPSECWENSASWITGETIQIQYLLHKKKMFAVRAASCTSLRLIGLCQLHGLSASNWRVGRPTYEISISIKRSF